MFNISLMSQKNISVNFTVQSRNGDKGLINIQLNFVDISKISVSKVRFQIFHLLVQPLDIIYLKFNQDVGVSHKQQVIYIPNNSADKFEVPSQITQCKELLLKFFFSNIKSSEYCLNRNYSSQPRICRRKFTH